MKRQPFNKGAIVVFHVDVRRGEHNMLVGRQGVVEGRHGSRILVRCTEQGTVYQGSLWATPGKNLRHVKP